jgi:hypothetical protein
MWGYLVALAVGYFCARIHEKSDKIAQIHTTIAEHSPGFIDSWSKTIQTVAKIQWDGVYDTYVRKIRTPSYITHDIFEVEYFHKGKRYRIHLKDTLKDRVSLNVYDQHGTDITGKFLEYFGPQYDFHNRSYTPRDLGYTKIVIIDGGLNEVEYSADEVIKITNASE